MDEKTGTEAPGFQAHE